MPLIRPKGFTILEWLNKQDEISSVKLKAEREAAYIKLEKKLKKIDAEAEILKKD